MQTVTMHSYTAVKTRTDRTSKTSSVRAIREIEPKLVVAMGNVDGMVTELKLTARTEKKLKIKNADSLPAVKEVVVLG